MHVLYVGWGKLLALATPILILLVLWASTCQILKLGHVMANVTLCSSGGNMFECCITNKCKYTTCVA
jgi:hypothetical protein